MKFGAAPVDWLVPAENATAIRQLITGWARSPTRDSIATLGDWKWLDAWLGRVTTDPNVVAPAIFLAIAGILILAKLIIRKPPGLSCYTAIGFAPLIVVVAFWFLSAPDPRFAGAIFWSLSCYSLAVALWPQFFNWKLSTDVTFELRQRRGKLTTETRRSRRKKPQGTGWKGVSRNAQKELDRNVSRYREGSNAKSFISSSSIPFVSLCLRGSSLLIFAEVDLSAN